MHLKRQKTPKSWPTYRKGTKYIIKPKSAPGAGVPLLLAARDMLKVARNRKEVKRAIFMKHILVNNKTPRDEKKPVLLFDTVSLVPAGKSYRLDLTEKGKFTLTEIKSSEANKKAAKVIDKKVLKGKKVQLNFSDGKNLISDIGCKVNDSVLLNFKEKKAEKCLPLTEGAMIVVFSGKHAGKRGKIKSMDLQKKIVEFEANKDRLNVLIKQVIVVE